MASHKTKVAFVRLNPEDHAEIKRRAQTAGISVSAYLRKAGLGLSIKPPTPAINRKAWTELARTASNINQLAHHLNEARITGRGNLDAQVLRTELRRMYGHIAALRKRLKGGCDL